MNEVVEPWVPVRSSSYGSTRYPDRVKWPFFLLLTLLLLESLLFTCYHPSDRAPSPSPSLRTPEVEDARGCEAERRYREHFQRSCKRELQHCRQSMQLWTNFVTAGKDRHFSERLEKGSLKMELMILDCFNDLELFEVPPAMARAHGRLSLSLRLCQECLLLLKQGYKSEKSELGRQIYEIARAKLKNASQLCDEGEREMDRLLDKP